MRLSKRLGGLILGQHVNLQIDVVAPVRLSVQVALTDKHERCEKHGFERQHR